MKELPVKLRPSNKHLFNEYRYNRNLCKLRMYVYEFMLSEEFVSGKHSSFNLQEDNVRELSLPLEWVNKLIVELINLGWDAKLTYGNTCLSIISPGEKHKDAVCRIID